MYVSQEPIVLNQETTKKRSTARKKTRLIKPKGSNALSSNETFLKRKTNRISSESDKDSTCVEQKNNKNKNAIEAIRDSQKDNYQCFLCKWKYPEMMTLEERNSHVNLCLDHKGQKHKESYLSSLKLAAIGEEMILDCRTGTHCPLCCKAFKKKGLDYKIKHIQDCFEPNSVQSPKRTMKKNRSSRLG